MLKIKSFLFSFLLVFGVAHAEQRVDSDYFPKNKTSYFKGKVSPKVFIDEAHNNFHTFSGRYAPFVKVLESDGYIVKKASDKFSKNSLSKINILVIANPLSDENKSNWSLPNYPAFTRKETESIFHWVKNGGSLLLIADHMPWPKASEDLAAIFGFHFNNGFVEILGKRKQFFSLEDNSLATHPITKGIKPTDSVSKIQGFMGQAFLAPVDAKPLLIFTKPAVSYMPSEPFAIDESTPTIPVTNWLQGATLEFGKGRVAVFGEAGMFTAQVSSEGDETWTMGFNTEGAEQNERFLLNTMLWLSNEL